MQKANRHILSTRPLSETLLQEAAVHDISITETSFIKIKPITSESLSENITELFQKPIAAVFTSANAVTALVPFFQKPNGWKIYCISNTTARLITELFKMHLSGIGANADALADVVIKDQIKKVYFFCSDIRRDTLPEKLRNAGIAVEEIVVYETIETPETVERDYDGILFYSPSAVHSFFSVNKIAATVILFAIGFTTAEAIMHYTSNTILISDTTSKEDLVHKMIEHFNAQKLKDA